MATAKKLPSGSWRCQVFSHYEPVFDDNGHLVIDPKTKKPKRKRIYESFTSDDPTRRGKVEAEALANEFYLNNRNKKHHPERLTLYEAIGKYITASDPVLSPKTIEEYWKIRKNSFQGIMSLELRELTDDNLQEAINLETQRPNRRCKKNPRPVSPKTVRNAYGLISAVISQYAGSYVPKVKLPEVPQKIVDLPDPDVIFRIVKGTDLELPCLLAMWLSFSMEEIRGLTRESVQGNYITINQVVIDVAGKETWKDLAKTPTRIRRHRIPGYIKSLIDALPEDQNQLVPGSATAISRRFSRLMAKNGITMNFHKLRHVNASVMAFLKIPEKYALERGGWKSDRVMKKVYTHTFSDKRVETDEMIDRYFEDVLTLDKEGREYFDPAKYRAWLILFDKKDSKKAQNEFRKFMQHEVQHENSKPA